jgi:hypothetical protein
MLGLGRAVLQDQCLPRATQNIFFHDTTGSEECGPNVGFRTLNRSLELPPTPRAPGDGLVEQIDYFFEPVFFGLIHAYVFSEEPHVLAAAALLGLD